MHLWYHVKENKSEDKSMTISPVALWLNSAFAGFDEAVMMLVHRLYEMCGVFFTPFLELISVLGDGGIFLIILALFLMLFTRTRRYGLAILLSIAIGALITNLWLKPWIARPRPYTHEGSIFQQIWQTMGAHTESDKSFPSGHTTAAFSAMTGLFLVGNKKISWTAFIFGLLMGISRIYLGVHYPSDVLGGIMVGLIAGSLGAYISFKLPEAFYNKKLFRKKVG